MVVAHRFNSRARSSQSIVYECDTLALNLSLSDPERPESCVIVLDLYLPKYDGVAVLEAIEKNLCWPI